MSLFFPLLITNEASAAGLRDPPIAGTSEAVYLDGKGWTATGLLRTFPAGSGCFNSTSVGDHGTPPTWATNAGGLCGKCTFTEGTDLGVPGSGILAEKMGGELTPQQCCEVCGADAFCAAAVWQIGHNKWTGQPLGQCILKAASDAAHKVSRPNHTAIVPAGRSAWQVVSVAATVPGDLVTDLQRAGIIDDPLFGTNFKNASVWNGPLWNYSTVFDCAVGSTNQLLVFDGIKMGARIFLNGNFLFNASDQHRRYVFPVSSLLRPNANQLTVSFDSSIDMSAGRFMGCSGGWDWAPYSNARDSNTGLPVFTRGIWKSVYLLPLSSAAITSLVPLVKYTGTSWPTQPMVDGAAPFVVVTRVFLRSEQPVSGVLTVTGSWGGSATAQVRLSGDGATTQINVSVTAVGPKLWWARGMGRSSTMYNLTATFVPSRDGAVASSDAVSASRRIGFRLLVLVTVNDTDPGEVAAARLREGNGNHTLMLRLNGVPVVGLGANMVPMEILEGRYAIGMHRQIVQTAADGGMSLLRVWGGGIYPFEEWLDACDELGVLAIVDMMYGTDGSGKAPDQPDPQAVSTVLFTHITVVYSVSHHSSLPYSRVLSAYTAHALRQRNRQRSFGTMCGVCRITHRWQCTRDATSAWASEWPYSTTLCSRLSLPRTTPDRSATPRPLLAIALAWTVSRASPMAATSRQSTGQAVTPPLHLQPHALRSRPTPTATQNGAHGTAPTDTARTPRHPPLPHRQLSACSSPISTTRVVPQESPPPHQRRAVPCASRPPRAKLACGWAHLVIATSKRMPRVATSVLEADGTAASPTRQGSAQPAARTQMMQCSCRDSGDPSITVRKFTARTMEGQVRRPLRPF
jgi:hypothetical protein